MAASDADAAPTGLILKLDGFEGPLDLLLDLARAQKVDLARISILALVEQFLAIVEGARRVRLELAADWLVMAAWLAWLKSRLLLPDDPEAAEDGEAAATSLTGRLEALGRMRAAAVWLAARAQLGETVFARGAPESLVAIDRSELALDVPGLMRAYLLSARRAAGRRMYRPKAQTLWSVQQALERLRGLMAVVPEWSALERFLPGGFDDPLAARGAMASTLLAGLEMVRDGALVLRQEEAFGPILVGRVART